MQISQKFFSFTGYLIVIGALISAVGNALKPLEPATQEGIESFISRSLLSDTLLIAGVPLVILGLAGLFLRQSPKLPKWGWVGYVLTGIGLIYVDIVQPVIRLVAYPIVLTDARTEEEIYNAVTTIYDQDPFGYMFPLLIMSLIGPIWSAVSFWKAKVFPVWMAIMMLMILPLFIISPMLGFDNFPVYVYVVIGIYGYKLISDKSAVENNVPDQPAVVTK
ncbi:MAG TPA: hypothetical protein VNM69_12195 [Bacillus sp. (in: firmicutes)]|uniref:hypothetical protein n=1 Tax=Bacillus litorisediminis TaxID=2922713 RepID=UPI001FADD51E|nr:hypothetical protein [Bacillus litorisediminis]HWO76640.1 hypothetical protein [Bacillus sp. (in: firmicutes)]